MRGVEASLKLKAHGSGRAKGGAKARRFETLAALTAQHGQQSMSQLAHAAKENGIEPMAKALQHVAFQTASTPLTQGYKVGLRQPGYGLNVYDGPLGVFLTASLPFSTTSQAQPLPNWVAPAVLNSSTNAS